jgi:hypothetical protein
VLGGEVFQFLVTLRDGGEGEDGNGGEVVIGMMGSHHWGEVGYLLDPGMFVLESFSFLTPSVFGKQSTCTHSCSLRGGACSG